MTRIFLTGGSGLLGNNILRAGLSQGLQFTTMSRSVVDQTPYHGLQLELITGDLLDTATIDRSVRESELVIHSAAHIHIGWKQREQGLQINRQGTQNIVDAALKYNKPLIHVSTVNTLAIGAAHQPADEDSPGDGQISSTYVVSKRAAERVVREGITQRGLKATIVYPGFMLGPNDWKPSSGRMVAALAKGSPPMSPSGGCSVCDARDVANAIVKIAHEQIMGERFILAGHNMSYFELWTAMAKRLGRRGPITVLRKPGQIVVGWVSDYLLSRGGKEVDTNSAAIQMGSQFHYYSSARAAERLGYKTRPFEQTLEDTIVWLSDHGKLS